MYVPVLSEALLFICNVCLFLFLVLIVMTHTPLKIYVQKAIDKSKFVRCTILFVCGIGFVRMIIVMAGR